MIGIGISLLLFGLFIRILNYIHIKHLERTQREECRFHKWVMRTTYNPEYKGEHLVCENCGYEPSYSGRDDK